MAERFGAFADWGDWLVEHPRGFATRLVTFELTEDRALLNLDDPKALLERSLRPSRVVTRDRRTTQAWAGEIFEEGAWAGVSWWSYYNPDWQSCALWCEPGAGVIPGLKVVGVEQLHAGHEAVAEAERCLLRKWAQ